MKNYFVLFILIFFAGCVANPQPNTQKVIISKPDIIKKPISKPYVEKHNIAFYEKKIKEIKEKKVRKIEMIKFIKSIIQKIPKEEKKSLFNPITECIKILKVKTYVDYYYESKYGKEEDFIDKNIKILKKEKRGSSYKEIESIEEKIQILKQIKIKQKENILNECIKILKKNNHFETSRTIRLLEDVKYKRHVFDSDKKSAIKVLKDIEKNNILDYNKWLLNKIKQEEVSIYKKYSKKILKQIKKKEAQKYKKYSKKELQRIQKKEISIYKEYSKKVLYEIKKKEYSLYKRYSTKYSKKVWQETEKNKVLSSIEVINNKRYLLTSEKKQIDDEISELIIKKENLVKKKKEPNIDPYFFGKANLKSVCKSKKNLNKKDLTFVVNSHKYTIIDSYEKLQKLKNIRTYVLLPKHLNNSETKRYKRYTKVLKLIQEFDKVKTNSSNKSTSGIDKITNKFILFGNYLQNDKNITIENYNYDLSNIVLDVLKYKFRAKNTQSFFNNDGPFLITMTKNIFDDKEFEFLFIDLSKFNNSAIEEAIYTYSNRLCNDGISDVGVLERFRLTFVSFLVDFNDNIHLFTELVAKE